MGGVKAFVILAISFPTAQQKLLLRVLQTSLKSFLVQRVVVDLFVALTAPHVAIFSMRLSPVAACSDMVTIVVNGQIRVKEAISLLLPEGLTRYGSVSLGTAAKMVEVASVPAERLLEATSNSGKQEKTKKLKVW